MRGRGGLLLPQARGTSMVRLLDVGEPSSSGIKW